LVTSRTVSDDHLDYKGVAFEFRPASLYAYILGANILHRINDEDQTGVSAGNSPIFGVNQK